MKILTINSVPYGSTCNVMNGISEVASEKYDVTIATGYSYHPVDFLVRYLPIGGLINKIVHMLLAILTGNNGCFSFFVTKKILKQIDQICPDIIHLHNIHGWFIHIPTLFSYIKKRKIRVIWTLHDCWSFTGHCPHFTISKCDKWKTGCRNCPSYRDYPQSILDNSKKMFARKKGWFVGVKNMTLIAPSEWLARLVKQSFLKDYPVKVINNGIDLDIFKPTQSNFRKKYSCEDKYILLGVAFGWGKRKGLDVFIELSKRLDGKKYQIVLVGTDDTVDNKLPKNIISIHRTQNQTELAEIYTASDLFVNPTREEVFGLVNVEALACGTPVVTFRTGGSPETLDEKTGSVVECDDIDALEKEIARIYAERPFKISECLNRAKSFDMNDRFKEYMRLYEDVIKN